MIQKRSSKRPTISITCRANTDDNVVSRHYAEAIESVGGSAILLPHTENQQVLDTYLSLSDGLLLSGGGDPDALIFDEQPHPKIGRVDPIRDQMELYLVQQSLDRNLPLLGICRGAQMMNLAMGGTIFQDIASQIPDSDVNHYQQGVGWYAAHTIHIQTGSILHRSTNKTVSRVNSYHHQSIRDLASGFEATATATDGVVEAIENSSYTFAVGVQFHPELMWKRHTIAEQLFNRFVDATSQFGS